MLVSASLSFFAVKDVRQKHTVSMVIVSTQNAISACRLLDDNRELFVPELNEVVKPHPSFMLFATQVRLVVNKSSYDELLT